MTRAMKSRGRASSSPGCCDCVVFVAVWLCGLCGCVAVWPCGPLWLEFVEFCGVFVGFVSV